MWKLQPANEQVKRRIIKLLLQRVRMTTDNIMNVLKEASDGEIADALVNLRSEGCIACANKYWYIRDRNKVDDYR